MNFICAFFHSLTLLFALLSPCIALGAETLDPIVFTSNPKPQASVAVISVEDLDHKSYTQVLEILKYEAGLDVISNGAIGQTTTMFIRGAKSEHTLVLIDGVEVNDATSPARVFDFANLTTENIKRIEVYKGAQTVRFGPDAIGGVINIITKSGKSPAERNFYFEAGSYGTINLNFGLQNSYKDLRYSLGLSAAQTQGFSAAEAGPNSENDNWRRLALSTKAEYDLTKNLKLESTLRLSQTDTDLDQGGGLSGDDPNFTSEAQVSILGVKLYYLNLEKKLEAHLGAFYTENQRQYDNPSDSLSPTVFEESFNSQTWKVENTYAISLGPNSILDAILSFRDESAHSEQVLNGTGSSFPKESQSFWGQALNLRQKLSSLSIELGARHDLVNFMNSDSLWSYAFKLEHHLKVWDLKTFFNYGTGIKTPSLFQLHSNFGNTNLEPEEARSWDIAIERIFFNTHVFTLAYFNQSYKNLIDFDMGSSRYGNISKAKIQGLEFTSVHDLIKSLQLQFNYRYLDTFDELRGASLLRRPEHSLSAQLEWQHGLSSLQLGVRYTDSRPDIDPDSYSSVLLPSYLVTHLMGSYPITKGLNMKLRVVNLLDEKYQEVAGYRTARRSVYLGLAGRF